MRFYFASCENDAFTKVLKRSRIRYGLFSYYYLASKVKGEDGLGKRVDRLCNDYRHTTLMCDSGAATLQRGMTSKAFDDFTNEYGEFLAQYSKRFEVCVELDLYNVFPKKKITEARRYLATKCDNLMPVWHVNMDMRDWRRFIGEYKFVAIGITRLLPITKINALIKVAYEAGVKVHGFAVTQMKKLYHCPFYSVDSTTWQNGVRYGNYLEFEKGIIKKHISPRLIARRSKIKVDNPNVFGDADALLESGIVAFQHMETYLTRLWEARGIKWTKT